MDVIVKFNKARIEIESHFKGLPHAHTTLIKSLINSADPITGIVIDVSYRDLSMLLTIDQAHGRVDSGIPKKETIRSYLRSIEKQCSKDFEVASEGQKLQFKFPNLPSIYARFLNNERVYTEQSTNQSIANNIEKYGKYEDLQRDKYIEQYTELYTPKILVIDNNNKIIKTNNNNSMQPIGDKNFRQPISPVFYPSQETQERARLSGFTFATDPNVIQEFIDFNKAIGSQWVDYNPIFLNFLSKYKQHKQSTPPQQCIQPTNIADELSIETNNINLNTSNTLSPSSDTVKQLSAEEIFWGTKEKIEQPQALKEAFSTKEIINNKKQPISDDFKPSEETITRALAFGYYSVTDKAEIQAFINFNKASGSQWVDFNPLYLTWLTKSHTNKQKTLRKDNDNHSKQSDARKSNARQRVEQAYASQFVLCEKTNRYTSRTLHRQPIDCNVMAATN